MNQHSKNALIKPLFDNMTLTIVGAGCKNRCKHCSVDAKVSADVLLSSAQIKDTLTMLEAERKKAPPFYGQVMPCLMYEPMDHPEIVAIQKLFHDLNPNAGLVRTMATTF